MIYIDEEKICPTKAAEVYSWICDIENYKTWIPHCSDSGISKKINEHSHEAYITMDLGLWEKKLLTRNTYTAATTVKMELVKGPFRTFEGLWTLESLGENSTRVRLQIQAALQLGFLEPAAQLMISQYRGQLIALLQRRFFVERSN